MYEISKKLRMVARMYEAPSIPVPFASTSSITELALEKILRFSFFLKRRERFSFCVLIEDTSINNKTTLPSTHKHRCQLLSAQEA